MPRSAIVSALLFLACVPIFAAFVAVILYGVDVPFYDQWEGLAVDLINWFKNRTTFETLTRQANESRPLVPRLIFLPLALATGWNVLVEMLLNVALLSAVSLCILHLIRRTTTLSQAWALVLWFFANLLLFSFAQYSNLLQGTQVVITLPCLFLVVGILGLQSDRLSPARKAMVAVTCALLSTYSFAGGLVVWIA